MTSYSAKHEYTWKGILLGILSELGFSLALSAVLVLLGFVALAVAR